MNLIYRYQKPHCTSVETAIIVSTKCREQSSTFEIDVHVERILVSMVQIDHVR